MDLFELLFKKIWNQWKGDPQKKRGLSDGAVRLIDVKGSLTLLARALTGSPIEIISAEEEGGYTPAVFLLPAVCDRFQTLRENRDYYLFRIVYLSIEKKLDLNKTSAGPYSIELSRQKAIEDSLKILPQLLEEYPSLKTLHDHLLNQLLSKPHPSKIPFLNFLYGRWFSPLKAASEDIASLPQNSERKKDSEQTEIQGPARDEVEILKIDRKAVEDYTLAHNFEKVETLEEFQGNWRDLDSADELDQHADALNELKLKHLVRTDNPSHSVYRSDFRMQASIPESSERTSSGFYHCYDEWDGRNKNYRKNYCKLYPGPFQILSPEFAQTTLRNKQPLLRRMKRELAHVFHERELSLREKEGEEPDLTAMVEAFADLRASRPVSDRLYKSLRKKRRSLSLLFLVDRSLSTDAYTGGARVIDVEKEALLLFGEVLNEHEDRFQIDTFSSHTRNRCDYLTLKSFSENWQRAKNRIGGLFPQGYTRIGPAIRHATHLLEKEPTEQRWLILLTDGKPSDYDVYEGSYGIADVAQALREAHGKGIEAFGLAIEAQAKNYLPRMLGHGRYAILPRPELLPQALKEFYVRLVR